MKVASYEGFGTTDSEEERPPERPRAVSLPSGAVRGEALPQPLPRPPEISPEKAAEAAKGVLLFSREAIDEEDEDAEEDTEKPAPARTTIPQPRQEAEHIFVYPEADKEVSAPVQVQEKAVSLPEENIETTLDSEPLPPLESYASEPLPQIVSESVPAGESEPFYEEAAEVSPPPVSAPVYVRPAPQTTEWAPSPNPNTSPDVVTVPPMYARSGHAGGVPPATPPGGRFGGPGGGHDALGGGPGGPDGPDLPPPGAFGPESVEPEEPPLPITPPSVPRANFNAAPKSMPERVNSADWLARVVAVAAFLRASKRKVNKRVDKLETSTKRGQTELHTRQERFAAEQRQQNRDINRLQAEQQQQRQNLDKQQLGKPETAPLPPVMNIEQQQQQEEAIRQQQLEVQPDQRVQQEGWLWSVVDKHGRPVQDAVQYGESFQRERQQEAIQDRTAATAGPASAASGAGLGVGAGIGATQNVGVPSGAPQSQYGAPAPTQQYTPTPTSYQDSLPSGMTAPTLPPGAPTHIDAQHQLPATAEKRPVSGLAFWIMLFIIIAAFFVAALI